MADKKTDEDVIAAEATKLANLRLKAKNDEEVAGKLIIENKRLAKALAQTQDETNVVQVVVAVGGMSVGTVLGYTLNKRLRKYTRDKKWVNDKGERSIGSIILVDVVPPAVGFAGMVAGAYIPNGPLGAGVMGFTGGLATGSILSTLTSNKCSDACDDLPKG